MRAGVGVTAFWQQFLRKVHSLRGEEAIASTSSPSGSSILPIDQVRLGGTVRHTTPPGGRWEFTNEQQVDEVGGSRCSVALYSRPGSRRICDAARRNGGAKRWRTASSRLVRHQHRRLGLQGTQPRSTRARVSPFRLSLGQRRGRFWAGEYSCWRRGLRWKSACNATQASICQAPTLTGCTTRRRSANWPGTSAMDGGLATFLELISTTIARWPGVPPRSISGLR